MSASHDEIPAIPHATPAVTDGEDPERPGCRLLDLVWIQEPSVDGREPMTELPSELSLRAAVRYHRVRRGRAPDRREDIVALLSHDIAEIDALLSQQVNAILHHPRFQRLEAAWRGLLYLINATEGAENVEIRILDITKSELYDDLTTALEFDQSELFRKVYEAEFGMAGGTPYGVLIADFDFSDAPDDTELLKAISGVAASSFCPFIAGVDPRMFGVQDFEYLPRVQNLDSYFRTPRFVKWQALRSTEDARFVGLVLPRVLLRLPYTDDTRRNDGFVFREDVSGHFRLKYLWGNAAFAFGGVLIRAFIDHGWFADIRGAHRSGNRGGRVEELPVQSFDTDTQGVALKSSVAVAIDGRMERQLSELGFIPLCDCQDTEYSVFYTNPSLQRPQVYNDEVATVNARLSAMLQYILCASRFAHYLKVRGRDYVGGGMDASKVQTQLNEWVQQYVTQDSSASPATRARYPLGEGRIEVRDHPAEPGHYFADFYLRPHFQLDELSASIKFTSAL
jgi:type VI secretion system ImpC/EvpB family protein